MDVAWCMGTHSDTKTSGNCVTGRRKRHELFVPRQRVIAAAVLSCVLLAPSRSYSERTPNHDDRVVLELSALGKQGDTIARARGQVLEILQNGNACTAWFQEADPAPAEVFRSLLFELEMRGPSYVYGMRDNERGQLLKHPWAARSIEYGGRNSTILLNANGPFFNRTSIIMQLDPRGMLPRPGGNRPLVISSYSGNTPEAQITILLHELGTSSGVFLRTMIPGTGDLPETLPRCCGIARPRLARPHTTVPEAASEPQFRRLTRQRKPSSARQTPQEAAATASWA
jgi:hypothetical protein